MSVRDFCAEDILDFSEDKFERQLLKFRKKPTYMTWEITNACNLRCKHCGLPDVGEPLKDELNTSEACEVVDNIVDSGARGALLSGGEPLARKDILDIASYASRSLSVSIQTNGYLLERYASALKDIGIEHVQVSLDGARAETHDQLRGEGSFRRTVRGIEACRDLGFLQLSVAAVIHQQNFHELPELMSFVLDLGADFFGARAFTPWGKGKQFSELALSMEQRRELYKYLAEKQQELKVVGSEDPYMLIVNRAALDTCLDPYNPIVGIGCAAGIFGCVIKPNGKVLPCSGVAAEVGDLRNESLKDLWKDSPVLQLLRDRRSLKGKCGACEYKYICGGCRGSAAMHSKGDVMAEDPLCWHQPILDM